MHMDIPMHICIIMERLIAVMLRILAFSLIVLYDTMPPHRCQGVFSNGRQFIL